MSKERTPEYWQDVEKTILAGIINGYIEPLPPELFEPDGYFTLAKTALALHNAGKPVNIDTVIESSPNNLHTIREVAGNRLDLDYTDFIEALKDRYKKRQISEMTKTVQRMLSAESPADAIADYTAKAMARVQAIDTPAKAPESLSDTVKSMWQDGQDRKGKHIAGLNLAGFERLTKHMDGLQSGLYLILAATNIGKTAFLSAGFVNSLLENTTERPAVMVFSLDDSKKDFIYRLLCQKSGLPINHIKMIDRITRHDDKQALSNAYEALENETRLFVYDIDTITHPKKTAFDVLERLVRTEHAAATAAGMPFVLCVDGLHNLNTGGNVEGIREQNIDRAGKIKTLADSLDIPVVCTVEARKGSSEKQQKKSIDDIMETGKYGFNAHVVFALNPIDKDIEIEIAPPEKFILPEMVVECSFNKNKRSGFKNTMLFRFDKRDIDQSISGKTDGKDWTESWTENVKTRLKECTKEESMSIWTALKEAAKKAAKEKKDNQNSWQKTGNNSAPKGKDKDGQPTTGISGMLGGGLCPK